ncbi:MAG: hypothetical protein HYW63_03455 [Candidatus Levybacteria bacterium]|nr:hypothetical protein [Candidatus Levybacteria bacterium]
MERLRHLEVPLNGHHYASDGSEIDTETKDPYERVCISSVAFHEGVHAFLAIKRGVGVKQASRIPGPGYLGKTEPYDFDGVAAVGPAALGLEGCGHDLRLASYKGVNIGAAKATGRQMVSEDPRGLRRVSAVIEQKGSATGGELEEALNKGENVLVRIRRRDGTTEERLEEDVRGETVMVPFQEYKLPKAA